jgi:DNA-binding MarR family transcriptional regulator
VVSRQIAKLAAAGLVERRSAPEDGRAASVRVSEQGERELTHWRRLHPDFFNSALGDWAEQDVRDLTQRLAAVNEDLRAVLAGDEQIPLTAGSRHDTN